LSLLVQTLAMACWTSCASEPQIEERFEGSSWVLTAERRQAGGVAARAGRRSVRRGRMEVVFMVGRYWCSGFVGSLYWESVRELTVVACKRM
jgi:hypothetical protein